MYMRASGASERKILHFHILKLLFLSKFCWYFRYFVGTNGMLVGLHVPTNFQMYRQNSDKALLGGGGSCPPPPLATLVHRRTGPVSFMGLRSVARIFSPLLARKSSGFAGILHAFCQKIAI